MMKNYIVCVLTTRGIPNTGTVKIMKENMKMGSYISKSILVDIDRGTFFTDIFKLMIYVHHVLLLLLFSTLIFPILLFF